MVEVFYDEIAHETDGAYLFQIDDEKVWLPKSQCQLTEAGIVEIPEWLAIERGLV